jgi:hypothetical protein
LDQFVPAPIDPGDIAADSCMKEPVMEDVLFLALSVAFFAATLGMAFLFDRLRERK